MIISCSRRTDIPAIYSKWLIGRIRSGYCIVPNPFNPKQISRVSLKPGDVTAIIFWTRYPEPMIKHLDELDESGYKYYFQITINNYPGEYELNNPDINKVFDSVNHLKEKIGSEKIIWRYDPVILNNKLNFDFHTENFHFLIENLKNSVRKIIISKITPYKKVVNRMKEMEFDISKENNETFHRLIKTLSNTAKSNKLQIEICSYMHDLSSLGINSSKCIDNQILNDLFNLNLSYNKDKSQRMECGCHLSKDIGQYNSCLMNCIYCYANTSNKTALKNYGRHTVKTESLY
ncbi:MAG: DUF1848 domain-containing protein [Ignavibacteriae bacterium]|nr:DUF1848 domain-containing protein [Ignavibacteriota bacterium]